MVAPLTVGIALLLGVGIASRFRKSKSTPSGAYDTTPSQNTPIQLNDWIPVIYGEITVVPRLIGSYLDIDGSSYKQKNLYIIGSGYIDCTEFTLDKAQYSSSSFTTILPNALITEFDLSRVVSEANRNIEFEQNSTIYQYFPGIQARFYKIIVQYPDGLWGSTLSLTNYDYTSVEYKITVDDRDLPILQHREKDIGSPYFALDIDAGSVGEHRITITRITKIISGVTGTLLPPNINYIHNRSILIEAQAFRENQPNPRFDNVTLVAGTISVRYRSLRFACKASRKLQNYKDGKFSGDYLPNKTTAGAFIDGASRLKIAIDAETVQKEFTEDFNAVYYNSVTVSDLLQHIGYAVKATSIIEDNIIKLATASNNIDHAITQASISHNSIAHSITPEDEAGYNGIIANYFDQASAADAQYTPKWSSNPLTIALHGVTEKTRAEALTNYYLQILNQAQELYVFQTDILGGILKYGQKLAVLSGETSKISAFEGDDIMILDAGASSLSELVYFLSTDDVQALRGKITGNRFIFDAPSQITAINDTEYRLQIQGRDFNVSIGNTVTTRKPILANIIKIKQQNLNNYQITSLVKN